ncbi:hypothetical protein FKW77_000521 [Venturia effusa]|uniref:Uncharacterized protein n=1 Tax=Venturia effusa TaxID=50376 RepID=A0A517L2M5_9PEZI|nr:hypothetical protein FKW77_000521 [Venturia effusa]
MARPASSRRLLSRPQASVPEPVSSEENSETTKLASAATNPKKRSLDNVDDHEMQTQPKRRKGDVRGQKTPKPQSEAPVPVVKAGKAKTTTKSKTARTKTKTTKATKTKKVQRRWMACDECKSHRIACAHKTLREVGSAAPVPDRAAEPEQPENEPQESTEPAPHRGRKRKLSLVRNSAATAPSKLRKQHHATGNEQQHIFQAQPGRIESEQDLPGSTVEENNEDEQIQDLHSERRSVINDTDQDPEEEENPIEFAAFHEQTKEIANKQSELDERLADTEQKVGNLRGTKRQISKRFQDGHIGVRTEHEKEIVSSKSSEDSVTELKNENRRLEKLIAEMKVASERPLGDTARRPFPEHPEPPCDDLMMAKIYSQTTDVRQFTQRNVAAIGDSDLKEVVALRTEDAMDIMRDETWHALQTPTMKKRAPRFLLEAWLHRLLATLITLQSLHHLEEIDHDDFRHANKSIDTLIRGLEDIYGKADLRVNAVRGEINSLLNPDKYVKTPENVKKLKSLTAEARQKSNEALVQKLRSILGDFLKDDPQVGEELLDLVQDATTLSMQLGLQHSNLYFLWINDLPDIFDHTSELMEAHGSYFEPSDQDGKRILMVNQPAVMSVGSSDGSDYKTTPIVLKKAVVWMGEESLA